MAIDHFPPSEILEIASALWVDGKDLEVFDGYIIKLHNLDVTKVKTILGLDHKHEVVGTGLRFNDVLEDGRALVSEPFFSATKIIPAENDSDQYTQGNVEVTFGDHHYKNKIEIERTKIGDDYEVFTVTLIPSVDFPEKDILIYYKYFSKHLG